MTIVGFTFNKMNVERKENAQAAKVSVNHNVSFKDIEVVPLALGQQSKAAKVSFDFSAKYEPGVGSISLEGYVLFMADEKNLKEIEKKWKKDKKIDKELYVSILNNVLTKCNVQAILLSKEINLPPPLPLIPKQKK